MDEDDRHASVIPPTSPAGRPVRPVAAALRYRRAPSTGGHTRVIGRALVSGALLAVARAALADPSAGIGPEARDRPLQLLGLLLGVCTLLTLAWWWRQPPADPALLPLPEPGLFGPDTPPPTAALAVYRADPLDHPAAAGVLLAALGRTHPVLVAAPSTLTVPPVFGGPVFRARTPTPDAVRRALASMRRAGRTRAVVLLVLDHADPALVDRFRAVLPDGAGLTVLAASADRPDGILTRGAEGWRLTTATDVRVLPAASPLRAT